MASLPNNYNPNTPNTSNAPFSPNKESEDVDIPHIPDVPEIPDIHDASNDEDMLNIPYIPDIPDISGELDEEEEKEKEGPSKPKPNPEVIKHKLETMSSREKLGLLMANFDETQMAQYERYSRANINKAGVKKLANSVLNQSITANVVLSLSGLSKVFICEVVEKAMEVKQRMNEAAGLDESKGQLPLQPEHIREAWRLFKFESGTVPSAKWRRQGGEGDGFMFR